MATRIASAGLMAGVLVEGNKVVAYQHAAIRLRPLGDGYRMVVSSSGEATATRIILDRKG
jgi:hypothetical protein